MICFPNAKINLGLHILNKRNDGFHNIESLFYPVAGLTDVLEVISNYDIEPKNKCLFASGGLTIDGNTNNNLIVKAYHLLDAKFNLPPVKVYLQKRIPMGAGLGGGSSDAAYMLMLLNKQYSLGITDNQLTQYASLLGSDCAFFLKREPSYLLGKGHELSKVNFSLKNNYLVMVFTGAHSNTALAYKHATPRNISNADNALMLILNQNKGKWKANLKNDFEASVFKQIAELPNIKQWLYNQGAFYAAMSGSGSCMFGLFKSKPSLSGKWLGHVIHQQIL